MPRRPKNKNKEKYKGSQTELSAVKAAALFKVTRATIYRWRKEQAKLKDAASKAPNQYITPTTTVKRQYILHPGLEQRLLDWIKLMRQTKGLCISMKCIVLMIGKFDADFATARTRCALLSWTARFLKRNKLVVRRITHKGTKIRTNMQEIADVFSRTINCEVEGDGFFPSSYTEIERYGSLFNTDQTSVGIDNPGRLTIDVRGAKHVDVMQGIGVPGANIYTEVSNPSWGHPNVIHTTQQKAWCDHATMLKWIDEIWKPSTQGCRMLLLDSLRVHKMESVKQYLEDTCCTKVQYIPPGITGLSQPMDVSVMHAFKSKIQDIYLAWHMDHDFPRSASERRLLLSHFVGTAWDMIAPQTIINGFRKANHIPEGPRDANGKFRTFLLPPPKDAVVPK